jgi:RHS repeat-associated protein
VWRARIDAYGTAHVDIGQDFHQPLRWPGHYFDAETGLHDNRFRTYSPELGRYLQSDPSGTAGGGNLYAYTDNPLTAVDLRGMEQSCPEGTPNCPFKKEGGDDKEGTKIPNDDLLAPPAKRGDAPIGKDGKPVELLHRNQTPDSPLDEMTMTDHRGKGNFKKNHTNTGQEPSKIDRKAWKNEQKDYWKKEWGSERFKDM